MAPYSVDYVRTPKIYSITYFDENRFYNNNCNSPRGLQTYKYLPVPQRLVAIISVGTIQIKT